MHVTSAVFLYLSDLNYFMKYCIALCALLATFFTGYTQLSGIVAIEDPKFDEQFAKGTIPKVTGKLTSTTARSIFRIRTT